MTKQALFEANELQEKISELGNGLSNLKQVQGGSQDVLARRRFENIDYLKATGALYNVFLTIDRHCPDDYEALLRRIGEILKGASDFFEAELEKL